ncbi:hypothetical protein FTO70_02165 [Methanosarcina sp. KYL-1]|nr:hypothetical protein [Methanosarcina sp. KYL-1]
MLQQLQTTSQGLTDEQAQQRLKYYGANLLKPKKRSDALSILLSQFKSPITLILLFAAGLSFFLRDATDAVVIVVVVILSYRMFSFWLPTLLGFPLAYYLQHSKNRTFNSKL